MATLFEDNNKYTGSLAPEFDGNTTNFNGFFDRTATPSTRIANAQVLGTSTNNNGPYMTPVPVMTPVPPGTDLKADQKTTTSGGGGKTTNTNTGNNEDSLKSEIDAIFNPLNNYLKSVTSTLNKGWSSTQNDIDSLYNESSRNLTQQSNEALNTIQTQEQGGMQRKDDAVTEARRLYNDLMRGGMQRYGGSTSAGEAFQSISGQELQRNNAQIQQDFSNFMSQIENAKNVVTQRVSLALENLESQKTRMLSEARRTFDARLDEITRMKSDAESEKAKYRLQALTDLRNEAYKINMDNANGQSYVQNLASQYNNSLSQETQAYMNQLGLTQQGQDSFNQQTENVGPSFGLDNTGGSQPTNQMSMVGIRDKDELTGVLNPMQKINDDYLFRNSL